MGADSKLSAEAAARFVLGLNQGYTKEDVKRAYRRLALVFHPDKNAGQNEEEATKRFQSIAKAKDLLLGLADRSGGSAASAARDLNARKSAAETKAQTTYMAVWVCGACQMRDLGSSPGSSARTSTPCARATASTSCFCGHSFEEHRLNESSKGSPKLRCTHPGCGCAEFSYVPPGALCTCGHGPTAHDERPFHGCKVSGCTCQTFHHAGMCACRHSWACHRTELRRVSGNSSKGGSPKKTFCPWWKQSCCEQDTSPSSSDSSSSIPTSEPAPPKPRSRPASADVHGRSRPAPTSTSRTSTTSGLFNASFLRSRSQMFSAGPRRRRPSSSRPSSARSASSSSHGVPLDVRGHPLNPSASSGPKPASAPPSSRGTPLPPEFGRAKEGDVPKTRPTQPSTPKSRDRDATPRPSRGPTPPSTPKARDAGTPRHSRGPTPPGTPKARDESARPQFGRATPPGTPKASWESHSTGRPPSTPATVTPASTPRHSEASACEPPPQPNAVPRPPKPRTRPSSAPASRKASSSDLPHTVPTPARGGAVPNWRPPRPSSASTPRPAPPAPAPAPAKDAPKESASEGGSGIKTPSAEKATAFFPEEPVEPDAEPDTEPEAAEVDEEDEPRASEAPRREETTSARFSDWKSKPHARSTSCVGRPCGSASSVATAAAAAAAAAVARDGRPWWERLHERKGFNKVHRRSGGIPRRPAPEAAADTEKREEVPPCPNSTGDCGNAGSSSDPHPRPAPSVAETRVPGDDAQEDGFLSSLGASWRTSPAEPSPFCGMEGDDEGACDMNAVRNNSQAMLKRLAALRRALETSVI